MSKILNVEIKAKCNDQKFVHDKLIELGAIDKGIDHQIDTYFNNPNGRLKLRQGNIENSLIFYKRSNQSGPKSSDINLVRLDKDNELRDLLNAAYGTFKVVDKKRRILFINEVKFHIDTVLDLGNFVEIEVRDETCSRSIQELEKICSDYMDILKINEHDLISQSYSDLIDAV